MHVKSVKDFNLSDKRALLRADLNVPVQSGRVTDTSRIDRLKPTIDYLRAGGAKILILSHFGRPEGAQNPEMSLAFLMPVLKKRWGCAVRFCQDCIGPQAAQASSTLQAGEVLLLENVRFHKGEEKNDPDFARQLAVLGDLYVNDAFSAAHRAHASTEGLAHLLPAAAGLLMEEEINALDKALGNPQRPVAAIAGGSKISTKLKVLNNLVEKVDLLILGGAMANTFLHALGGDIGSSMCEKDMAGEAKKISEKAKARNCEIILPVDSVTVSDLKPGAEYQVTDSRHVPPERMAVDIGPQTAEMIGQKLKNCRTVVWNGPMGVFEIKPFDRGTNMVAQQVSELTKAGTIISVAGGGDTQAALENAGAADGFSYISTAGGAFLEWLEGRILPGVAALARN